MHSSHDRLSRLLRGPGLVGQVLRFAMVGGLGFLVDAAILQSLVHLGVRAVLARVASIAVAVVVTWVLNRNLTFAARRPPSWSEFGAYLLNSLVGMLVNYGLFSAAMLLHAPLMAALAIGTVAGAVFNFIRYRRLLSERGAGEI